MSAAAMVAPATRVFTELWISFSSLTKSHLAALEINNRLKDVEVVEESSQLRLVSSDASLNIGFDVEDGLGMWTFSQATRGTVAGRWQMFEDATVTFFAPTSTMELELAVEKFCMMLMV